MKVVLVEKDLAPYGCKCLCCNKIAKAGQFVLLHSIKNVGHFVIHRGCGQELLETVPDDLTGDLAMEYDRIRNDYIEGRVF